MIGRFDADGVVLFANQGFLECLGLSQQDMQRLRLREVLAPAWADRLFACLSTLTPDHDEACLEEHVLSPDGERWTLWKFRALAFDADARCREVEAIGVDITETKRTQAELLETNRRLQDTERDLNRAQAIAQIGSWHLDGRTGSFTWSAETYRIFGIAPSNVPTLEMFLAAVHPEDRAATEEAFSLALASAQTDYKFQHRIVVDGEVRWLQESAALTWDDRGQLVELCGTCQDITASLNTERELRLSERRFKALVDASSEIVVRFDDQARLLSDPTAWEEFSGRTAEESAGTGWLEMIHPDDRAGALHAWLDALARKSTYRTEYRLRGTNGVWQWVSWTSSPVLGERGEIVEWVGMYADISERKDLEVTLEHRVAERTAELAFAKEEATRANVEKSRFLSAASHDLRQPLHAASLYLDALQRRAETAEQRELCAKMDKTLSSTSDMLRALLDISRLESGAIVREPRPFLVQDLLDRVIANSRAQAEMKGLSLLNAPTQLVACTDPALFERIVDNFVTNAVRYTEPGGAITISSSSSGTKLRVAVEDTGVGIPDDARDKIFNEYVQLGNPERGRSNGLGLGLAIAKHIASLLNCRLKVISQPGVGSTFSVETEAGIVIQSAPTDSGQATRQTSPVSLLLVEDDPLVADAASLVLTDAGFIVTCAANGDEAMARVHEGLRPTAILSDYWLPKENGLQLVERLRVALKATVPAVLITGDTELQAATLGIEQCGVLHKPVDARHLTGMLRQFAA